VSADLADAAGMVVGGAGIVPRARVGLPLEQSARLTGAYCWLERRLFAVLGAWAPADPVPEVRALFDVLSQQHAWHAELWAERLPVLDALEPEALTVAPDPDVEALFEKLAGPGGTLLRLAGLARVVLPRLVAGYAVHLRRSSPMGEAPTVRVLRLVLAEETDAWTACEAMIQHLLRRPSDIAAVTERQQELEALVAHGHPGLVAWHCVDAAWRPPAAVAPDEREAWPGLLTGSVD
jgi:hypothetical protein